MPDITPAVYALLLQTGAQVYYQHPAAFASYPSVVFSQSGSAVHAQADAKPYLHAIEYTVEVWSDTPESLHPLAAAIDEKLSALGLQRQYSLDLYDPMVHAHRRILRYRALCDENALLTQ